MLIIKMKEFANASGYKQKFIAESLEISQHDLSLILNGKKKCSVELYAKFCNFFKLDYGTFIEESISTPKGA